LLYDNSGCVDSSKYNLGGNGRVSNGNKLVVAMMVKQVTR